MKTLNILDFDVPIVRSFDYTADQIERNILTEKGITMLSTSWNCSVNVKRIGVENSYPNLVILANTIEEKEYFESSVNCDVLYCNHNAFLNENNFTIKNTPKIFDLVINSCFAEYKHVELANKIPNTIHFGYFLRERKHTIPSFGYLPNFLDNSAEKIENNYKMFKNSDLCKYFNMAKVGGIFSHIEGACFGSSEYLLCGIPVVSTKSKGGRDLWYNNENSIICENTPVSVKECVEQSISNLDNNIFNGEIIRNLHMEQMDKIRNELTHYTRDKIEDLTGENVNENALKKSLSYFHQT